MNLSAKTLKISVAAALLGICAIGIFMRFDHITENKLFFFDEGHYLTIQRQFVHMVEANPPQSFAEFSKILKYTLYLSLTTGKTLWFFLSHLRGFFLGFDALFFPRLLAAIFGSLTLGALFLFARRFYKSNMTALLSVAVLALLPSHVFYSRLGLQETLSTLCLLLGLYFYLFSRKLSTQIILSGICFAAVYFSNYRMFITPILVGFCELFLCLAEKRRFDFRKFSWSMIVFGGLIVFFGSLNDAKHMEIIFFWMLRQSGMAKSQFDALNFLSYPYAIFRLESLLFGVLFFGNIYFAVKKDWRKLFPFAICILQILIFSFAQTQGIRYLCAVMPFMAMATASLAVEVFEQKKNKFSRSVVIIIILLMFAQHFAKANEIRQFDSDYKTVMDDLKAGNQNIKLLATQPFILNLYSPKRENIQPVPDKFESLVALYATGHQYLVLGPQAYVTYTESGNHFENKLQPHLQFIKNQITPYKVYPHFNQMMMERFVFEHNDNLRRTLVFLKTNHLGGMGKLYVYETKQCVEEVFKRIESRKKSQQGS